MTTENQAQNMKPLRCQLNTINVKEGIIVTAYLLA